MKFGEIVPGDLWYRDGVVIWIALSVVHERRQPGYGTPMRIVWLKLHATEHFCGDERTILEERAWDFDTVDRAVVIISAKSIQDPQSTDDR